MNQTYASNFILSSLFKGLHSFSTIFFHKNILQRLIILSKVLIIVLLWTVGNSPLQAQNIDDTFKDEDLSYKITSLSPPEVAVSGCHGFDPMGKLLIPSTVIHDGNKYSVTSIASLAFYNCNGYTEVIIANSVTSIAESAFFNFIYLTKVIIGNSVTSIGDWAFASCRRLKEIAIPNSVTSIGAYAFEDCRALIEVTIGSSVSSIGAFAFHFCDYLSSFSVDASNPFYSSQDGVLFNGDKSILVRYPVRNKRKTYSIPNSVSTIGELAFCQSSILMEVSIPNSVTTIGASAFCQCDYLTEVVISNSVISIGKFAFAQCFSLTEMIIPNSINLIETGTFEYCSSLLKVSIPNSATSIEDRAFYSCSSLTEVSIGNSVNFIGAKAFYDCLSLISFFVDPANKAYSSQDGVLFNKDRSLLVQYPIGNNRESYTIPNSVSFIGDRAFKYCSDLTEIIIPNTIISIGVEAFSNCSGLSEIIIPNSVTSIRGSAFYSCIGLKEVTIPSSLILMEEWAFENCYKLHTIISYIEKPAVVKLGSKVFNYVPKETCVLQVPSGKVGAYKEVGQWKDFLNIIEMTETGIEPNLTAPQWIIFPNPVQEILNIGSDSSIQPSVKVYSLTGTLILDKISSQINVSEWQEGIYIIEIDGRTESFVKL